MRILICGAGIAGLTLAYWLLRDGVEPVVVEKAPDLRTQGYIIDFAGTGYDVAKRMQLASQLREYDLGLNQILYHNANGGIAALLSLQRLYEAANVQDKFYTMDRRDLVRALHDALHGRCHIRYNRSLQAVEQDADGVSVTFDNGSRERFDLLIGADGIHSQTRALVFGDEQQFARDLGYHFAIFYTPRLDPTLEYGFHVYVEPGSQVAIYPVDNNRWMVFVAYRSDESVPHRDHHLVLKQHLQGIGWVVPEVLAQLSSDTPIFMDTVTQIDMPAWSNGRIAVIGDAAYCPTLISGQGASMAMAGAYLLAQALRQEDNHIAAFAQVEGWLRPHITRIQAKSRSFAPTFIPRSRLRILLTHWAIRLIDISIVSRFVGKRFSVESIFDRSELPDFRS